MQSGDEIVQRRRQAGERLPRVRCRTARQPDKPLRSSSSGRVNESKQGGWQRRGAGMRSPQELTFEVPPQPLRQFGLVMKMGPITACRMNSPAADAGLKRATSSKRSTASRSDGRRDGWTPDDAARLLCALRPTRDAKSSSESFAAVRGDAEPTRMTVRHHAARAERPSLRLVPTGLPWACRALGIAYEIENEVVGVIPGGPGSGGRDHARRRDRDGHGRVPEIAAGTRRSGHRQVRPDKPGWFESLLRSLRIGAAVPQVSELAGAGRYGAVRAGRHDGSNSGFYAAPKSSRARSTSRRNFRSRAYSSRPAASCFEPIERIRTATTFAEQVQATAGTRRSTR